MVTVVGDTVLYSWNSLREYNLNASPKRTQTRGGMDMFINWRESFHKVHTYQTTKVYTLQFCQLCINKDGKKHKWMIYSLLQESAPRLCALPNAWEFS